MNPLDVLDPNMSDERYAEFYGDAVTDYVRDDHPLSAVRHDDKVQAHEWFSELMLLILDPEGEQDEPLAYWDEAIKVVKELRGWKKLVSDIVEQQNGPHLREMLKELIE
tara:strand:- start:152 stop:478 length:327 start_codon:yes stop_codon:yes gene_type:complete